MSRVCCRSFHPADAPVDAGQQAVATAWSAVIEQPTRHVLVAEAVGLVVGTIDCMVVSNLTHDGRPYIVVENVVVDRGWRRRRVATQLLEAVIELARDLGCYKLQLMSHRERRQAHAFYERMPFLPSAQGYRRYL